jgi:type II secretory pathway predicted ATPase ExeA
MYRQESKEYVCHHLKAAGATSSIFTDDALEESILNRLSSHNSAVGFHAKFL